MSTNSTSYESFLLHLDCPIEDPVIQDLFDMMKTRIFAQIRPEVMELQKLKSLHSEMSKIQELLQ